MDCDDFEKTLKVIVVGNGSVGKTSMTTRYAKGKYTGNYKKTIGVDFMEKTVELRDMGETVNLMIWDTAGQEEFDALTSRYYKGAGAVIYVFSTVDRDSFDDLPKWKRKVEDECGRICHVLVQNKIDLVDDAAMSRAEVEDMADYMNIRLFRSCVQDNVNVKEVFEHLCRQFLKFGGSGGSDDALGAVADITSLSELAHRTSDRSGGSGAGHSNSSGRDSRTDRGRDDRESWTYHDSRTDRDWRDDREDRRRDYEHNERSSQQQQQRGAAAVTRGLGDKSFPPSVPASIAHDRTRSSEDYGGRDYNSDRSDDNERDQRRSDRRRPRKQKQRKHQRRRRDDDSDNDDDDDYDRRDERRDDVRKDDERGNDRRQRSEQRLKGRRDTNKRDATRLSDRSDEVAAVTARAPTTTPAIDAPCTEPHVVANAVSDSDGRAERTPSSAHESMDDDGAMRAADAANVAVDDAYEQESAAADDDAAAPTPSFKLEPSKRRTNGKKRPPVPECVLS